MEFNLNQQKTNQLKTNHQKIRPQPILKRITSLLLVLMLLATAMPSIAVKAESNIRTLTPVVTYYNDDGELTSKNYYTIDLTGTGHLVARACYLRNEESNTYQLFIAFFSNEPMNYSVAQEIYNSDGAYLQTNEESNGLVQCTSENGTFYTRQITLGLSSCEILYTGVPNVTICTSIDGYNAWHDYLLANPPDLTKDDYITDEDIDESTAIYNKDLDFSTISADYKAKYTIEKDNDGHWNFITPDEAGIQFDWTNRTDIDGAYVRFNVYGEYYDSFWSTSYTNTYVTLTCERKNDLTYLCNQKQMISLAKEKCNGSKGYGFVVNYIYVQAFAKIDGTLYRSRIYKFNSDLVSDYGNADAEDDEWVPEVTGGDSMPEDYEPDPDNPDPEKTEPAPDKDDDTVIDYPVEDNPDVIINDDTTYLEAFKQFINVMKQGIAYLGDFPSLINSVFSFIPSIFLVFIGVGFAVALVLRFLGR